MCFEPGSYPVMSMSALVAIIKNFDLDIVAEKIVLCVKGKEINVKALGNGYLELDGEVPTIAHERELDEVIKQHGAYVKYTYRRRQASLPYLDLAA